MEGEDIAAFGVVTIKSPGKIAWELNNHSQYFSTDHFDITQDKESEDWF